MFELTAEDFKRAKPNPFIDKLCKKVEIFVKNEDYDVYKKIGDNNGVEPELIMNRALASYAKQLEEAE